MRAGLLVLLITVAAWVIPAPMAAAQAQRVEAWGENTFGQLGDGTTDERHTAVTVAGLTAAGVTDLDAGDRHGLAALANGTVKAWGYNFSGQLGNGTTGGTSGTPATVRGLDNVTAVAAGCDHSLALLSDGTVRAWGNNNSGQLGNGTIGGQNATPSTVINLTGVRAIAAGCTHNLALLSDGTVRAWGNNLWGQLGNGTTGGQSATPSTVINLTGVQDIDGGGNHSLARLADGTVRAWGYNGFGELGVGLIGGSSATPLTVMDLTGVQDIAAGGNHSLALLSDGTVRAWGNNDHGQIALGQITGPVAIPAGPVINLTGVQDIAAGGAHNLALLSDGTVQAWGSNDHGQLGVGGPVFSTSYVSGPVTVHTGIGNVTHITAGGRFNLAA